MSARDKFWSERVTQNIPYVKFTTVNIPEVKFLVSSSSTNTILNVLPTSSAGIRFYSSFGYELTENTRLEIQPNTSPQIIVAKVATTGFDERSANTVIEFPIRFELTETPVPPPPPPAPTSGAGPGWVCRPCYDDNRGTTGFDGNCRPGEVCTFVAGQRCCVDESDTNGRETTFE